MLNQEQKDVKKYLRYLQKEFKLNDWEVIIAFTGETSKDCYAWVNVESNYYTATISVPANFFNESAEKQKSVLIHEMIHVVADSNLHAVKGKGLREVLNAQEERTTDRLTMVLSRYLEPFPLSK